MGNQQTWFEGSKLLANDLTLYWGQRQYLAGSPSDEIRLVRSGGKCMVDEKLVILFCKHPTNTEPRIVFGHPQTPGVDTFTRRYEKSPKPTFDDLLILLANYIAHARAA